MTTQTSKAQSRTFDAKIAVLYASHGHRTVVSVPGENHLPSVLPLTDATVTLRPGELFMATGANGQTGYFTDLEPAVAFTRHTGSAGTPGAIVVLVPCTGSDGFSGFNVDQVYKHSRPAASRSF